MSTRADDAPCRRMNASARSRPSWLPAFCGFASGPRCQLKNSRKSRKKPHPMALQFLRKRGSVCVSVNGIRDSYKEPKREHER